MYKKNSLDWIRIAAAFLMGLPLISFATAVVRPAAPCTLSWDASPDPNVAGYALYYGPVGSSTTNRFDAGKSQAATLYNLSSTTRYFFFVKAYNAQGWESAASNVVSHEPPLTTPLRLNPQPDGNLRLRFELRPEPAAGLNTPPP
jgi:hypothetical protein